MIRVGVLKADYSLSFHDKFTAGFGAKGSYSTNGNTSRIDRLTGESWEADPRSQSNITGDERLGAAPVVFHIESHNQWRDETALYRVIKLTYSRTFGKNVRKVNYTMNEDEKERIRL